MSEERGSAGLATSPARRVFVSCLLKVAEVVFSKEGLGWRGLRV